MKVAIFTETFVPATDGVVTRLRHTVEELVRGGDEVIVFAPGRGEDSYAGARVFRVPGIRFAQYPQIRLAPPNVWAGRALRKFQPDVVHVANPVVLGLGGVYWARSEKLPLVCSYHTNVAKYAPYYRLEFMVDFARNATRFVHNQAQVNLCTSESTMDYLLEEGIKRVRLWPQGVDARNFHPKKRSEKWRERLSDGHPEEKVLLYVGRLAPEKHIENLKAMFGAAGCRLAIVGDGPARDFLKKEFAGTPTVFTGTLKGEDLAGAFASADALIFPSTTDTLGMVMLEAMASGLPVMAARIGASNEVVCEGETGLLYEPHSGPALEAAVWDLFSDDARLAEMGRRARAVAEERDWENSTRKLRGYYELARRALRDPAWR